MCERLIFKWDLLRVSYLNSVCLSSLSWCSLKGFLFRLLFSKGTSFWIESSASISIRNCLCARVFGRLHFSKLVCLCSSWLIRPTWASSLLYKWCLNITSLVLCYNIVQLRVLSRYFLEVEGVSHMPPCRTAPLVAWSGITKSFSDSSKGFLFVLWAFPSLFWGWNACGASHVSRR